MEKERITMPAVALRGLTLMPGMIIHFDISRKQSIAAVEKAMVGDQRILLVGQIQADEPEISLENLHRIGTIGSVKQLAKLPGGVVRVMVEGLERAELVTVLEEEPGLFVEAEELGYESEDIGPIEREAMLRVLKDKLEEYQTVNGKSARDIVPELLAIEELEELLDQIAIQIPWDYRIRQELLECVYLTRRYERTVELLIMEMEVYKIKKDFQTKVKAGIDKNQKDYILREQMKVIRQELGEEEDSLSEADEYLKQLGQLRASAEVKDKLKKEIARFKNMPASSQEANVLRIYIETLLELPWKKMSKDNNDLKRAARILNEDHYGLEKVKDRVLEYLAVRTLTKKGDAPILCLVGPPGTGKTSIARSVARALDKEYVRISLGGVRDEAEIRGHRKTYVGAMPGRVLDGEQNVRFRDHYVEVPIDLSEVLFIATANTTQTIPRPLLDRMDIIEVNSYTENEKFHIAKDYLVGKQLEKNGLTKKQLSISDSALEKIIRNYTREAGVRNLERRISNICRKSAREILENKKKSIRVTEHSLEKYLGKERVTYENANEEDQVGIVRGLAWTSVGGDTLQIEVNTMPGKGELMLTGQMGDVMKESARTALTYVRSVAMEYGVAEDYFEKHNIHIHIPEGAVPKDGPSAGITMATAMLSAVSGRLVSAKVAMTGEITLRGRALPIGGLKEKILAARMAGIKKVLVPEKNQPDIAELSREITKGLEIVFVKNMEDVLREAFV